GCWEGAFGKDTYDADKADKIRREENKKHVKPITVKLKASKNPADIGDVIDIQAEASEGTGGYAYRWSGCISESKDASAKASFKNQCKTCAVAITVTDQDGNSASDSITLQCSPIKVKLTKESPKENNIPIGGKAAFFAEVFSGDKPFTGPTLKYLWERNPDAVFGDPKNPQYEQKAGSQARNTALFRNIGTTPVWVVVQREIDGRWATIGESEQIMINVVKPKIKLQLNKKEPFIGEKVVLTVHEEPKMSDDFITFWWEYSGNISNPGVEPNISNSRAYSFKPKDAKPVTVTVHAKAKDGGDDLGQAKITITPKSYSVAISEPRYLGPKPRIWKCDTQLGGACPGLVEVGDTQFAVFRDIFMKAIITPSPDSPRYRWTVDPSGSCGFPGSGNEIKINCSNTGTYTVKVEVANADGAKLGEAAQAVTVSISQEQLGGATKSKEAYDKVQQAKQLVVQGKLDEGITLAEEASRLDPKNTEAKSLSDKWKDDVKAIRKHIVTSEQLQKDNMLAEAERELQAARALHPKYPPLIVAENRLKAKKEEINKKKAEAQRLKTEGEALERQGNLQSAVNKYKESIRTLPDKTLEEHIRKLETQIAQNAQKKTASDRLWDECAALAKQGRNQEALQKCRESLNYWSDDKRRAAIVQLENAVKQEEQKKAAADRLWDECSALAKQNRLNEALSKCKESLNHWSSDKRISATKDLENTINQATQKKAISDRLWDECAALAKQGRNQEALQKCRESLNYWSSEKRVAVVKELENKVKQTTAIQPPIAPPVAPPADSSYGGIQDAGSQFYLVDLTPYGGKKGSPRKAKNIEVDDGSWIRLKATHEKRLFLDITLPTPISASSIAIVSNLDNAHYVKDDVITTVLTVYTKSGSHRFEFKAGVHSSEWNRGETGGADHRFPKENHLGDKRWLAVFNLPQGSVVTGMRFDHRDTDKKFYHAGAAPGFCLRGITLIRSGITGGFTGSGNITSTEKQKGNVIYDNGNIGGVYNNPTKATVFTINQPHVITLIQNYHWNNAKGSTPGTIGVKSQSGKMYGPWQAKGSPGQGGVPNAYWTVYPNITLPAGTYTVIDSTPSTWAQNSGSNGAGFTRIEGYPVSGGGGQQSGNTIQQGRTITAEFVNSSPQNIHIFVEGQDTFGSHNRITPNERKRVNIKAPAQADFIKFNAGRNGQVLAACRWEYDPDNISGRI
ncbi:MAG: hypothetical protein KG029_00885, partial [Bacteroidetes bacterium]|nr:hypothetical protein [Bacteroidota bacterium]